MRTYISDIISEEDIKQWQNGNRILITAQTGTGKSEFIKVKLYDYCYRNNKSCLLLSNRDILKRQNINDINTEDTNVIECLNYQKLETQILRSETLEEIFEKYDIIVYDEVHYIFSDSSFNRNTDLLIRPLLETPSNKIFIFITATPQVVLKYQPYYNFKYTVNNDYSYIQNIYFYNKDAVPEAILQKLPMNEKAIYFSSNAKDAWELSTKFFDSAFICSDSNELRKKSDKITIDQIVAKSKFTARILCTTKILDNGINIKDETVKHIIIDMLDPISLIQCLGRKRSLNENDKINIYIKNYHAGNLYYVIGDIRNKLKLVKDFEKMNEDQFRSQYRKKSFDAVIDNDYKINDAKYYSYLFQEHYLGEMLSDKDKQGYRKYISRTLGALVSDTLDADKEYEIKSITDILETMTGKKLFKEDQEIFKSIFFETFFSPKKTNYRRRGIGSINAILREDDIPFMLDSLRENKRNQNHKKQYWVVTKLESDPKMDINPLNDAMSISGSKYENEEEL